MTLIAAVILAAGEGTRMKSRIPKVLHRLCGAPIVSIVGDVARSAGLDTIVCVVPGGMSLVEDTLGPGYVFAQQDRPLGTGHALIQARQLTYGFDNLVVMCGDTPLLTPETVDALISTHLRSEAPITVLTSTSTDPNGLGRVVRHGSGRVKSIVEQRDADPGTLTSEEINTGLLCFQTGWLWHNLPDVEPSTSGEVYLTSLVELAVEQGYDVATVLLDDGDEAVGVNTRVDLSIAESVLRDRIRRRWMLEGVTMPDPSSVYIDYGATIGIDTVVHPNTHIQGSTEIGEACVIGPNTIVVDSTIGDRSSVVASVAREATLESDVHVGPFSHIRPGAHLESDVRVGNFGEIKNSRIGSGTRSGHFSYIGDAQVGSNVNIGAGSITCNYDGENKNETVIGNDVFIGCDTMMVAPVTIGDRSYTGTGSVVNKDVPPDSGAIGAPARIRRRSSREA